MGRIWFSSDYHFWHSELAKNTRNETDILRLNRLIIKRHNERVKPEDTLIFLGDFMLNDYDNKLDNKNLINDILSKMNGKFIFIQGNHDPNNGLKSILKSAVIDLGGQEIHLSHKPEDFDQRYKLNLVGHVHGAWKIKTLPNKTKLVNVGVDVWNYYPVNIQDILKLIAKDEEEFKNSDHHNENYYFREKSK